MSKRPKLDGLDDLFDRGADFQLTSEEYETITGAPLPRREKYLRQESALARWAKERGYIIADVQESVRTVTFKRRA